MTFRTTLTSIAGALAAARAMIWYRMAPRTKFLLGLYALLTLLIAFGGGWIAYRVWNTMAFAVQTQNQGGKIIWFSKGSRSFGDWRRMLCATAFGLDLLCVGLTISKYRRLADKVRLVD